MPSPGEGGYTATLLPDDDHVLIAGGHLRSTFDDTAELYDASEASVAGVGLWPRRLLLPRPRRSPAAES